MKRVVFSEFCLFASWIQSISCNQTVSQIDLALVQSLWNPSNQDEVSLQGLNYRVQYCKHSLNKFPFTQNFLWTKLDFIFFFFCYYTLQPQKSKQLKYRKTNEEGQRRTRLCVLSEHTEELIRYQHGRYSGLYVFLFQPHHGPHSLSRTVPCSLKPFGYMIEIRL